MPIKSLQSNGGVWSTRYTITPFFCLSWQLLQQESGSKVMVKHTLQRFKLSQVWIWVWPPPPTLQTKEPHFIINPKQDKEVTYSKTPTCPNQLEIWSFELCTAKPHYGFVFRSAHYDSYPKISRTVYLKGSEAGPELEPLNFRNHTWFYLIL